MELIVNGISCTQADRLSIAALIEREGFAGRRVAVEVNGEIIPRSAHGVHRLAPGDRVEIVQAIGGG